MSVIKKKGKLEKKMLIGLFVIFLLVMLSTGLTIFTGFLQEALEEVLDTLKMKAEMSVVNLTMPLTFSDSYEDIEKAFDEFHDLSDEEQLRSAEERSNYGKFVEDWLEYGEDDFYYYVIKSLEQTKEDYGLNDIFVYKAAEDENGAIINDMTIVFNLPNEGEEKYSLGYHYGESQAYSTIKKVYETGEAHSAEDIFKGQRNLVLVSFAPIKNNDGKVVAVLGVEQDLYAIIFTILNSYYFLLIDAALNFLVFAIIVFLFLKISVVKPISVISSHVNSFASDERTLNYDPITEIHTKDEIEQIADDFNSLAQRTIDYTKNLEIKTTEEERLRLDLDVASHIRDIVSSESKYPAFPERSDFDLCISLNRTMYNKCSFVNYFFTDTNHLFLVIGESLGNSFSSMIFSILSISYIKGYAKRGFDPYKIAAETNNELCSAEKKDSGLTVGAVIACVDLKMGTMKYVNAGMPPILIKKPGDNFTPDKANLPFSLGQMRGVSFEQNTIQLYQGSTVLFTSFGVTEMSGQNGTLYGYDRLVDVMNRISGNVYALNDTINELEKDLDAFGDSSARSHDTAILGFRYFG